MLTNNYYPVCVCTAGLCIVGLYKISTMSYHDSENATISATLLWREVLENINILS